MKEACILGATLGFLAGGVLLCTKIGKTINENMNDSLKFGKENLPKDILPGISKLDISDDGLEE